MRSGRSMVIVFRKYGSRIFHTRTILLRAANFSARDFRLAGRVALFFVISVALIATTGCSRKKPSQTAQSLDFNRDVQPILAAQCFSCHGPDPGMRKAGLRLDLAESAMKKRSGHPDAIVPGHPEQSELIKRIESKDHHYLMPQSHEGEAKPMRGEDIAVLRQWIKEGCRL